MTSGSTYSSVARRSRVIERADQETLDTMKLTTALALTFTVLASVTLAAGCGGDKSSSTGGAAASAAPAAAGGKPVVVASCVRKTACTEYRNNIPDLVEDLCKGTEGTFKKGASPCPTEKLVGTCTPKTSPDSVSFYYGGPDDAEIAKGLCDVLEGVWAAPTGGTAASGTAATGAAPGAAPQTKPAGAPPAAAPPTPAKEPAKDTKPTTKPAAPAKKKK